jgi:hypothetical protein
MAITGVAVGVTELVGVGEIVRVAVGVRLAVGVRVAVGVSVAVGVLLGVSVGRPMRAPKTAPAPVNPITMRVPAKSKAAPIE